ncbi:MAG: thioredoxin family protein [Spirochaetota bacterium]
MRHLFRFAAALVLLSTVIAPALSQDSSSGASGEGSGSGLWLDSFEEGLAEAEERGRALVLLITAPGWCEPCERFEGEALTDTGVIDLLENSFVAVRLTDRDPEHAEFSFPGYPSILVFHPSGRKLDAFGGLEGAREVRSALEPYRGGLEEALSASQSDGGIAYEFSEGAFVPAAEGEWLWEDNDGKTRSYSAYREDERFVYLQAEEQDDFIALPKDGGRAFRWDSESESWEPAWEITAPER